MEKKLLFVASSGVHIRNFHLPYLAEFQKQGWQVHVACRGSGELKPYADAVTELPFEKKILSAGNFAALGILRSLLRREAFGALIVHTTLAAFYARLAVALTEKLPVINVVHGYLFDEKSHPLKRFAYLSAERLLAPVTDLALTMNEWDEKCAKKYRLGKAVGFIPGMGVDFLRLDAQRFGDPGALRRELGLAEDDFAVLFPGEFSRRKSQMILLQAMESLPERVKLVLPGEGALLEECRRYAKKRGISSRVVFPGRISQMGKYYEMADCLVSASRGEGLPFALLEGLHFGLPVVASRVKGHTDLVRDGENGFLYPYGDASGCAECILKVMNAPEKYRGDPGDMEKYSLEAVFPQVMDQYRRITEA